LAAFTGFLAVSILGLIASANAASPYAIDGFALGEKVQLDRGFRCEAGRNPGFKWCQKLRQERSNRGNFSSTTAIVQNADGVAVHVDRQIEPAFFAPGDIAREITRLSSGYFSGERAREIRLPQRDGLPLAVIALWGTLELQPLDDAALAALAVDDVPRQSLLVDHLGDLRRSAQLKLPVYRIGGSAGYLWSASMSAGGRGHLRFLAIDPTALTPKAPAPKVASPAAPKTAATKIASVLPVHSIPATPEPQAKSSLEVPPNTTIRAKTRPDQATDATVQSDRAPAAGEWFALDVTGQIPSGRSDADKPKLIQAAPRSETPATLRMEAIVVTVGAVAMLLFFIAWLIESRRREATGLEILELQWRRENAGAQGGWNFGRALARRFGPRLTKANLAASLLIGFAGGFLRRLAARP